MKGPVRAGPPADVVSPIAERILGAAFKAFMVKGYAGTSTLEIATRANVSKRDLYANFANKQTMLVACIRSRADRMRLSSPDLPEPRSRRMLSSTLESFGANVLRGVSDPKVMAMYRLAIAEAERSREVAVTLNATRSANRGALADLLAKAQQAGILDRGDARLMMEQFFALLWGDLMLSLLLGVAPSPKQAEIERRAKAATQAFLKMHAKPSRDGR